MVRLRTDRKWIARDLAVTIDTYGAAVTEPVVRRRDALIAEAWAENRRVVDLPCVGRGWRGTGHSNWAGSPTAAGRHHARKRLHDHRSGCGRAGGR